MNKSLWMRKLGEHMRSTSNHTQHTATYCNTLQHTATHCNTLQHTATAHEIYPKSVERTLVFGVDLMRCCSVLQCVAVCCSVLQCVAVCCSVVWGRSNVLAQLSHSEWIVLCVFCFRASLLLVKEHSTYTKKCWYHSFKQKHHRHIHV